MGFIFGLLIGASVSGGGSASLPPSMGTIPMRCLAAFEVSDDEYKQCRDRSLTSELLRLLGRLLCVLRQAHLLPTLRRG